MKKLTSFLGTEDLGLETPNWTQEEYVRRKIDLYNSRVIPQTDDYECTVCGNKEHYLVYNDETMDSNWVECFCKKIRQKKRKLKRYNLDTIFDYHSFDSYTANTQWQQQIKALAMDYAQNPVGWFFIGGQVGSGKTHIINAILQELLKENNSFEYINWRDDSIRLKDYVFSDHETYLTLLDQYHNVDVLVIDDVFKGNLSDTTNADVKLLFNIINKRYVERKPTLFTSEHTYQEIIKFEEAIGSRIYELANKYCINIARNSKQNARLNKDLR